MLVAVGTEAIGCGCCCLAPPTAVARCGSGEDSSSASPSSFSSSEAARPSLRGVADAGVLSREAARAACAVATSSGWRSTLAKAAWAVTDWLLRRGVLIAEVFPTPPAPAEAHAGIAGMGRGRGVAAPERTMPLPFPPALALALRAAALSVGTPREPPASVWEAALTTLRHSASASPPRPVAALASGGPPAALLRPVVLLLSPFVLSLLLRLLPSPAM